MIRVATLVFCLLFSSLACATATAEPRLGIDYEVLPSAQPTFVKGKVEVAEVFSYACHFCADFQPLVNQWSKTMPVGVRWEYVPASFGGTWDNFARAYFAAEILGVRKRTHDGVFKAIFVDQKVKRGTLEELADAYAGLGVDRARFLAAMQGLAVTAKLARAREFALRAGVKNTPTLILNGKYRITMTRDRGFEGALATLDYLIAKEAAVR